MTRGYGGGDGAKSTAAAERNAITRAIILARGLGTRMRERAQGGAAMDAAQAEAADRGVKAMIPIGRPFLDYVLSALADAGYTEACLVIGPEHDAIRDYYERDGAAAADAHLVRHPGRAARHGGRAARGGSVRERAAGLSGDERRQLLSR